jgi:hypothetical protein
MPPQPYPGPRSALAVLIATLSLWPSMYLTPISPPPAPTSSTVPRTDPRSPEYVENPGTVYRRYGAGVPYRVLCEPSLAADVAGSLDAYFPRWYLPQFSGPDFGLWPFEYAANVFASIGEPSLLCARAGVDETFRLHWDPQDGTGWTVRIERRADRIDLTAVQHEVAESDQYLRWIDRPGRVEPMRRIEHTLSLHDWKRLQVRVDALHLWYMTPTFRGRACQVEEWIFELTGPEAYHVVERAARFDGAFHDLGMFVLTELVRDAGELRPPPRRTPGPLDSLFGDSTHSQDFTGRIYGLGQPSSE